MRLDAVADWLAKLLSKTGTRMLYVCGYSEAMRRRSHGVFGRLDGCVRTGGTHGSLQQLARSGGRWRVQGR